MKKFEIQKSDISTELHIKDEHAEIREFKMDTDNENIIRLYKDSPKSFKLQIRTFKGIGEYGAGKKRNMIASVSFDKNEFEQIIKFVNENFDLN